MSLIFLGWGLILAVGLVACVGCWRARRFYLNARQERDVARAELTQNLERLIAAMPRLVNRRHEP
jgi:hypothetical protein